MYLSLNQSLQLIVIATSLLAITYLCISSKRKTFLIVPVVYFIALCAASVLQLVPLFEKDSSLKFLKLFLITIDGAIPALSFLLISQFIFKSLPPKYYWIVLVLPLVVAMPSIYLMLSCSMSISFFRIIVLQSLKRNLLLRHWMKQKA